MRGILAQSLKMNGCAYFTVLVLVILGCFMPLLPALADEDVLVFKQRNVVTGHFNVFISPHAVKLVNEQQHWRLISSAPDWKMYMFNEATKKYYVTEPKDFKGVISAFVLSARGFNFSKVSFAKEKSYEQDGIPLEKFKLIISSPHVPLARERLDSENLNLSTGECITLAKPTLPPALVHAICRFYCIPEQDKYILDLRARRPTAKGESVMLIYSKPTKMPYKASDFKHNVDGYTKCKSEYEVNVDVTEAIY